MANLKDTTVTGNLNVTGNAPGLVKAVKFATKNAYSQIAVIGSDKNLYCHSGNRGQTFTTCRNRNESHYVHWGIFPYAHPSHYGRIVDAQINQGATRYGWYLLDDGQLYAWGETGSGLGTAALIYQPTLSFTSVAEVYAQSCGHGGSGTGRLFVKRTDGTIWATGYNAQGQLGIGNTTTQLGWVQITALGTNLVRKIWNFGSGWGTTFAQLNDGRIFATGHNVNGCIGNGNTTNLSSFTDVTTAWGGLSPGNIDTLYVGDGFFETAGNESATTVMFRADGSIRTAGNNSWGSIGKGNVAAESVVSPYLVAPPAGKTWVKVSGSGGPVMTVLALTNANELYVWGYSNAFHHFSNSNVSSGTPTLRKTNILDISFNNEFDAHTYGYANALFASSNDGRLWSAGQNGQSQRGNNTTVNDDSSNTHVYGITDQRFDPVIHMARAGSTDGTAAIYAITQSGKLFGWGNNGSFELAPWNGSQFGGATEYRFDHAAH